MENSKKIPVVSKEVLVPFILITSLFALWGFANDITNPMVAAFETVMEISTAKAALVQFAFYGGYATMAIPAALFVQKYNYKKGIILGLVLYAIGGKFTKFASLFSALALIASPISSTLNILAFQVMT